MENVTYKNNKSERNIEKSSSINMISVTTCLFFMVFVSYVVSKNTTDINIEVYIPQGDKFSASPLEAIIPCSENLSVEEAMKQAFTQNLIYTAKWGAKMKNGTILQSYYVDSINGASNFNHPYNETLSRFWFVCINNFDLDVGISQKVLTCGDRITWYYIQYRQGLCQT
ncbi:unnamed protein product [Didymodactylos carnosus]|uniref:Transcobalamin-like C-terminal domain-containing protein n=1 Tax=Didymodactylos carnosus TaxID=1234261 RepID=A0A8S2UZG9_9BILA|nr:unnamed protein product [Didymodactylos carnosus]